MYHKFFIPAFVFILFTITDIKAQDSLFTYRDIETGLRTQFYPARYSNIQSINDDGFYMEKSDTFYFFEGKTKKLKHITDVFSINKMLKQLSVDTLDHLPNLFMNAPGVVHFYYRNKWYWIELSKNKVLQTIDIPNNFDEFDYCPANNLLLGLMGNNIALLDTAGKLNAITRDSLDGIVNARFIYREEFGISKGYLWSPSGRYLAYYKKDERNVGQYPLVDIHQRIAKVNYIRYPMAGTASEITTVHIYDILTGTTTNIQVDGDAYQYLTNLTFSVDEKNLFVQQLNHGQDTMWLTKFSVASGDVNDTLFIETNAKYVEPETPLLMSTKHRGSFYYQSERDGYNHIYYFDANTKKLKQITKGDWVVTSVVGLSADEKVLYFTSTIDGAMNNKLYAVDIRTCSVSCITQPAGIHTIYHTPGYSFFIDSYSDTAKALEVNVLDSKGNMVYNLVSSAHLLDNYRISIPEYGEITAADDRTSLIYRLVKPIDFDPDKQYPVVIYVYGGPHIQLIRNQWGGRQWFWQQYLAQQGVASFVLDCRGSANRGRDFEQVIHRQNGIPQLADQLKGVDFLKSLSWIDSNRMGVHGWSFGGYMTVLLMSKYPEVFKVGVAGGPVIDWKYYEVMYGERYMDTPAGNPEGYKATNAANYAKDLKGKLLIIQGAQDPVVVWQHALTYINACIEANKQVDQFVYPDHEHNVSGKYREHLVEKITSYFIENL